MNSKINTKIFKGIIGVALLFVMFIMCGAVVLAEDSAPRTTVQENGTEVVRFDYKSDEVNVKVTLSNPGDLPENAVLSVTPVEITTDMQQKLDEKAVEEQKAIKSAKAYDIKFTVDGKEVEPGATVKVTVITPEVAAGDTAAVYHVSDDVKTVENMNASTAEDGQIAFDTNHFSTYVITNKGTSNIQVTIEHYNSETNKKIYADDVKNLTVGAKINDYKKATNWDVKSIDVTPKSGTTKTYNGDSIADGLNLEFTSDTTVTIIYTPASSNIKGDTTFYDYLVKPTKTEDKWFPAENPTQWYQGYWGKVTSDAPELSINTSSNYPSNSITTNRFAIGTVNQNYSANQYNTLVNNKNINVYTGTGTTTNNNIRSGIITGLSEDYKTVNFSVYEPGVFSTDNKTGKTVLTDYDLEFEKTGDTYALTKVLNSAGTSTADNMSSFFPLDTAESNKSDNGFGSGHNYYFGMRYDVDFKLGDYVGPLNYSFSGDDDMWVLLDGQVVLDIGGIHDAISRDVNLWDKLGLSEGTGATTVEAQNQTHRLTVLYMERGGNLSNCNMKFTIPNAQITTVEDVPLANLELTKVNTKGETLEGASFKLAMNGEGNEAVQYTAGSDKDGEVNFSNLRVGTYTLTESSAPSDYTASDDSWIVEVVANADNKTATATVYVKNADGTKGAVVTDNKIINYTAQEILNKDLESSKTATVNNWDERTYDINITASSKASSTEETTEGGVADVMLVLDKSASMNRTVAGEEASLESVGRYKNVYRSLDKTKTYYWGNETQNTSGQSGYKAAKNPMRYMNGKWQYYDNEWNDCPAPAGSDKKIYTWESRETALKEASSSFLETMAINSPESKVGIATFSSTNYDNGGTLDKAINTISEIPSDLVKAINSLLATGGTMPQNGLKIAKTELARVKDSNKQYVILFTDGSPTGNSNEWNQTEANSAKVSAQGLKDAGVIVYTVGFALDSNTKAQNWLSEVASPNCAFNASDAESLQKIFDTIQSSITHNLDISNATVKDYIDTRFDILDDSGNKITTDTKDADNKNMADGGSITLSNGGVVHYDSTKKAFYVVWENQTIPNTANTGVQAWSKIITVKAKDNYIGGNAVTTNGADSAITVGTASKPLDQPTVNVKSDFTINNAEETIFWGDTVPLNDAIKAQLIQSALEKFNLSGYPVTANEFEIKLYTDASCATEITAEMLASLTPDAVINTYYAKVTYNNLGASTEQSYANTSDHISGDATEVDVNSTLTKGPATYTIHVVKGQIQITKTIDKQYTNIDKINANQTFVFKIEYFKNKPDLDANTVSKTFYETIAFDANQKDTVKSALVSQLEKGYYRVTEEETWSPKYKLDNTNKQTFYVGMKSNVVTDGKAAFTGLEVVNKDTEGTNANRYTQYADYYSATNNEVKEGPLTYGFLNKIDSNWNWLSDTASAINVFNTSK